MHIFRQQKYAWYRIKETYPRFTYILQENWPFCALLQKIDKLYINTVQNILENEINLILSHIPRKQKHGIITMVVSSFIALAYEGISSFLHHKK